MNINEFLSARITEDENEKTPRALAECRTKRIILNHYPATEEWVTEQHFSDPEPQYTQAGWNIDIALLAIAQPYAGHPDFKPEWKLP